MNIHKENPFDWFKALEEQQKLLLELDAYLESPSQDPIIQMEMDINNLIYQKEKRKLKDLASNWVTCACGNLCDVIPRRDDNSVREPADAILSSQGLIFSIAIGDSNWTLAIESLKLIEARAIQVLEELYPDAKFHQYPKD